MARPIGRGLGLYVHIPFCRSRCHYCDFACHAGRERQMEAYVAALEREISSYSGSVTPRGGVLDAATLYLGGGTPSLLQPGQLERVLRAARRHFALAEGAEVTMEVNPRTGSTDLWRVARAGGVNRVSVGAQVFDDALLESLGRDHDVTDVSRTVGELRDAGFADISLDLMFGLPGQDLVSWEATLDRALALGPQHFSVYGLQIEPHTVFGVRAERGQLQLPGEDAERQMLDLLVEKMAAAGYRRYEISSWARPGHESAHNRIYWLGRPYIGFGTGAHSYLARRRYAHDRSIDGYLDRPLPAIPARPQPLREAMEDAVFMGLRLVQDGVSFARFRRRFKRELGEVFGTAISRMLDLGMLEVRQDSLCLTPAALPVANVVFAEFLE